MKTQFVKKALSGAMVLMLMGNSISVNAESYSGDYLNYNIINPKFDENISTLEIKPPKNEKVGEVTLPYRAEPYPIYAQRSCYTSHYFKTETGNLNLDYSFYAESPCTGTRYVEFTVYKAKKTLFGFSWSRVISKEIKFIDRDDEFEHNTNPLYYSGNVKFTGLSKNDTYCICIRNNTPENEESSYYNAITGYVDISD